jgi:GT2 family glycosyltransferase
VTVAGPPSSRRSGGGGGAGAASPRVTVDVGVVTWNTAELTARALRHLLDSDQGCGVRVLVHDNASADGTPAVLARRVPEAQVEVSSENLGFARAVNRLVDRSDAPWFVALNSDAWPEPGALGRLVAAAVAHPDAAAVAPLLLRPDGSVEHSTHPFPSLTVAALDAVGGRAWLPRRVLDHLALEGAWMHDRPRRVDWAVGAALLLRRDALQTVGGFDERFFMYVEDLAWCWAAAQQGWSVWFEPSAVVRHVGNASGQRRFGDRRAALEEANLSTWMRGARGPLVADVHRALQVAAAGRAALAAQRAGRPADGAVWRQRVRVLLGLVPTPSPVQLDPRCAPSPLPTSSAVPVASAPSSAVAGAPPVVSVVVPTYARADRVARLLVALDGQRVEWPFEVVVVDDGSPPEHARAIDRAAAACSVPVTVVHQARRGPAAARNLGWRRATAPVVAFTDDDCVPDPDWLARGVAALAGRPRVVVGRTYPPADQRAWVDRPFARVMEVGDARFAETCNVFYRRADLAAVGGFDERFRRPSGEDTDLLLRMVSAGAEPVFAADAGVAHDVRPGGLRPALAEATRWADLPLVVRGRWDARQRLAHRWVFWKPTHPPALLAAAGLALAVRWRPAAVAAVPWVVHRLRSAPVCADPVRRVLWLPGALAVDLVEVATMVRGSVRHRTVLL